VLLRDESILAKDELFVVIFESNEAKLDLALESLTDKTFDANESGRGLFEVESRTCKTPTEGIVYSIQRF
jgi:hypothetical protein